MSKTRDLEKKLDALTSKVVLLSDKHCATCGSSEQLECGHWRSRYWRTLRWDLDNCHAQCHTCNQLHEIDTRNYDEWMYQNYSEDDYRALLNIGFSGRKIGYSEMLLIYEGLKEKEREFERD